MVSQLKTNKTASLQSSMSEESFKKRTGEERKIFTWPIGKGFTALKSNLWHLWNEYTLSLSGNLKNVRHAVVSTKKSSHQKKFRCQVKAIISSQSLLRKSHVVVITKNKRINIKSKTWWYPSRFREIDWGPDPEILAQILERLELRSHGEIVDLI